ncbi:hypothetical protein CHLRE_02g095051v5 [Chlamydomonas reinhardtii]|uniref:Uncharacterized protein n=1 Tax=Chlamydomonas reinhardtii TaxID=3055 RepID=A0A2K3E1K6_CHLRE|nr:uncharacterized protein CHLRE_02g095051v5 [Chlamydomonas reinhardtii]PNW86661.1 hypothetical protein CHLRE_02g095051v5 [Chlamydomonas reinhardtii]
MALCPPAPRPLPTWVRGELIVQHLPAGVKGLILRPRDRTTSDTLWGRTATGSCAILDWPFALQLSVSSNIQARLGDAHANDVVERCAELAADALRRGICVVVGLWEANLAAAAREVLATGLGEAGEGGADDGEDFLSAPKMIMHNFIIQ